MLVSIFLPSERTYLARTPQLTPEIVEKLLENVMDPVNGSNAKGRKPIGMCCLHVDDLFMTGTPEFLEKFKKVVKSQFKIGHEDVNDLMFTGQRVKWVIEEKTKKKSHIAVEQSLCFRELTEVVIPKGLKHEEKCDKDLHTAYRSLLGSINWLQPRTQFQSCYQFSRCASAASSPNIGDCKALDKLCRQIVGDPMELMFGQFKVIQGWLLCLMQRSETTVINHFNVLWLFSWLNLEGRKVRTPGVPDFL